MVTYVATCMDWVRSLQVYSAQENMVDFLSLCFAINTMFSFSKIQRRLSMWLWCDFEKRLAKLRPAAMECKELMAQKGFSLDDMAGCKQHIQSYREVEARRDLWRERIGIGVKVFKYIFAIVAILCVVAVLFSREPIIVSHPIRVALMGLGPVSLFFVCHLFFKFYAKGVILKECDRIVNGHLNGLKVASEIIQKVDISANQLQK